MKKFTSVFGITVCGAVAVLAALLFRGTRIESTVPLVFLLVIFLVTLYFGSVAGTVGTIFACFIFMAFLFEPIQNLIVRDPTAEAT